jgi:hypothetical protein
MLNNIQLKPNQCNIKPFCFHLHNVSPTPICPISPLLKPYTTNQTSVAMRCKYTPPPLYASAAVNIRPLPIFLFFFRIFTSYSVAIFHIYNIIYYVK